MFLYIYRSVSIVETLFTVRYELHVFIYIYIYIYIYILFRGF